MISSNKTPYEVPALDSEIQDFDYAALDAETRIVVKQRTSEIKSLVRRTAQDTFEIGEKLIEVKQKLGHGYFGDWLKAEFDWGEWTARKFMQVARRFKSVNFTDMDIAASALYILAADSTPEAARLEALDRANLGEPISHSKAKAIKTKAMNRQRKEVINKPQPNEPITIDIDAETVGQESSTGGKIPEAPLNWQYPAVNSVEVENSEEELLGKETNSEMSNSPEYEVNNKFSHLSLVNKQDQLSDVEPDYSSPLNMNKPLFNVFGLTDTSDQQVATVLETLKHNLGVEIFTRLVVESIPQDDVSDLCNKCLDSMDKQAFSRLAVNKINFSGLSESALSLLSQKSQHEINERQCR